MELKDILNIKIFKTEKEDSETCRYFAMEKEFEIAYVTKSEASNINTVGELLYFAKLDGVNEVKDFIEGLSKYLTIKIYDVEETAKFCKHLLKKFKCSIYFKNEQWAKNKFAIISEGEDFFYRTKAFKIKDYGISIDDFEDFFENYDIYADYFKFLDKITGDEIKIIEKENEISIFSEDYEIVASKNAIMLKREKLLENFVANPFAEFPPVKISELSIGFSFKFPNEKLEVKKYRRDWWDFNKMSLSDEYGLINNLEETLWDGRESIKYENLQTVENFIRCLKKYFVFSPEDETAKELMKALEDNRKGLKKIIDPIEKIRNETKEEKEKFLNSIFNMKLF